MRNDAKVAASFKRRNDGTRETITGCKIIFPAKYKQKSLASFTSIIEVLSVFYIELPDGTSGVQKNICMIRLAKTSYKIEKRFGEDMYVFDYAPGDLVFESKDIIIDKMLSYYVHEYFINRGYMPKFMTYDDAILMWENVEYTTGMPVGSYKEIIKFIVSYIARHPDDPTMSYREALAKGYKGKPRWIALKSVLFGPKTVTGKLIGAHFTPALMSSLLTDNKVPEKMETILRMG